MSLQYKNCFTYKNQSIKRLNHEFSVSQSGEKVVDSHNEF